jgi:hypothetical protein
MVQGMEDEKVAAVCRFKGTPRYAQSSHAFMEEWGKWGVFPSHSVTSSVLSDVLSDFTLMAQLSLSDRRRQLSKASCAQTEREQAAGSVLFHCL